MKKLFLGSISLLLFAIAIAVVQISCQKSVAQISTTSPSTHLMLYHTYDTVPVVYHVSGDTSFPEQDITINFPKNKYFISDLDGNNERQIPVIIPDGMYSGDYQKLTVDGSMLVFSLYEVTAPPTRSSSLQAVYYIYSCNIDGSDLKRIKTGAYVDDVH